MPTDNPLYGGPAAAQEAAAETYDRAYRDGQNALLRYLRNLAWKTDGAEVWRALFAEMIEADYARGGGKALYNL